MILEMGSLGLTAYNLYKQYRMHNGGKFFDVPETKKHLENISIEGNSTDVKTAKSVFMQWLLSIYEGVDYDFPE